MTAYEPSFCMKASRQLATAIQEKPRGLLRDIDVKRGLSCRRYAQSRNAFTQRTPLRAPTHLRASGVPSSSASVARFAALTFRSRSSDAVIEPSATTFPGSSEIVSEYN